MKLEKKLAEWRAAGLVDEATAARIAEHERGRQRPVLLIALGGLGALTLGLGIISIVAANWNAIPRTTKLGLDLAAGCMLAAALYRSATRGDGWLADALAGTYYLFVLASIALTGQLYQLGSPVHHGLLAWSVSTAPFMLLVRGPQLGSAWLAGLLATAGFSFAHLLERLNLRWSGDAVLDLALASACATVLGLLVASRLPWFVRERPLVSAAWSRSLWGIVTGFALALTLAFYAGAEPSVPRWSIVACGLMAGAVGRLVPRLYPELPRRAHAGMQALLATTWLLLAAASTIAHAGAPALAALLQVAVLALAAWTALAAGSIRAFNSLTALIALRVLVVYFEVFGSMLDTGLGLVTGGALTLLLASAWRRKSRELAARRGGGSEDGHA